MSETKTKLAFYDINDGDLAIQMQLAFEEAQEQAKLHNEPAKVKLEILVGAPDKTGKFGIVQFKIGKSFPVYKSVARTTELSKEGKIINDGESIVDVLQESLQFKDLSQPSIHKISTQQGEPS